MSDSKIQIVIDTKTGQANVVALGQKFGDLKQEGNKSFAVVNKGAEALRKALGLDIKLSEKLEGRFDRLSRMSNRVRDGIGGIVAKTKLWVPAIAAAGVALAGWKLKQLITDAAQVASQFDNMKLSLDTVTRGEGAEWFAKLNEWAMKMPINTQRAIQTFIQMRAMGLKPSIKDMTTLVDTVSALGDPEALGGISRALGQIVTKGRVQSEELLQLAERGIPVYEILREKMSLTSEELANIGKLGLDAKEVVSAILEGLDERFGGQSSKIQNQFSGLIESLKSYWTDFQRMVMEAGVMAFIEERLRALVDWVEDMRESGQLQEWASGIGEAFENMFNLIEDVTPAVRMFGLLVLDVLKGIAEVARWTVTAIKSIGEAISRVTRPVMEFFSLLDGAPAKVEIPFMASGSTTRPFTEKMDELTGRFDQFAMHLQGGQAAPDIYIPTPAAPMGVAAPVVAGSSTTTNTRTFNAGGINIHVSGDAAGTDWRQVVRDQIVPELKAAGVI